ncbi:MAG: hypothetical protein WA632_01290, partial [Gallionella sp.]
LELGATMVTEEHLAALSAKRFGNGGPTRPNFQSSVPFEVTRQTSTDTSLNNKPVKADMASLSTTGGNEERAIARTYSTKD